jgi:predicted NBD/HSP70 family sugar kinase
LGVELIGLGVAVPGVVCQHDGMVRVAPNLGWDETPVGKRLRERLGLPVVVGNDANLGAIAEHARGVAAGVDNLVYVHGEVGVGGGVISNGALLTGSAGYGGEVGHMRVNPQGSPCRCGSWGCWETEVGEDVLVAKAGRRSGGRPAVDKVLQAAAAGEPRAVAAVEDVARWLGVGLVNIAACYNPDMVVLGGLFATILSLAAPVIVAELSAGLTNSGHLDLVLVPPMLGDEAVLMGAAESAFDSLLGDPAQFPARSPARR